MLGISPLGICPLTIGLTAGLTAPDRLAGVAASQGFGVLGVGLSSHLGELVPVQTTFWAPSLSQAGSPRAAPVVVCSSRGLLHWGLFFGSGMLAASAPLRMGRA